MQPVYICAQPVYTETKLQRKVIPAVTNEEKILDILAMMQAGMQQQEARMVSMNMILENEIRPNFMLLAEGHQAILAALTPKSRVDELEDEVKVLRLAIRQINAELQELKKAQ